MDKRIYQELLNMAEERNIAVAENDTIRRFGNKGIYIANDDIKVIFIEKSLSDLAERNYILSHELGHHDLHASQGINQGNRCIRQIEEEADLYAYRLLGQLIEGIEKGQDIGGKLNHCFYRIEGDTIGENLIIAFIG